VEEAQRCLNCDVQTVFTDKLCIECDACVDICPMDCITFTQNGEAKDLRGSLNAPAKNATQDLYVRPAETQRVMVKDEDVCLHCGLCARALPHRRLGHAEVPGRDDLRPARAAGVITRRFP
jgi:ferredoxin